jgi:hypothetical protein
MLCLKYLALAGGIESPHKQNFENEISEKRFLYFQNEGKTIQIS